MDDRSRIFLMKWILVPLAHAILRLYLTMVKLETSNEETVTRHLEGGGKGIGAIWHQRFLGALRYAEKFRRYSPAIMISQSRDGEWIAQFISRIGFRPIRGSSSRGGKEALAAMVEDMALHQLAIHAVDGPQGPKGGVKAGLIRMAQLARVPIFPVFISVERAWILHSWDRFLIPKPFSRILVRFAGPIPVPEVLDPEAFEAFRLQMENLMIHEHARDDICFGWEKPL
jgi:hypothetical protein